MLRRLAAKCASAYANDTLVGYFSLQKVTIGVPGGCEAAVHEVPGFMDSMPDDHMSSLSWILVMPLIVCIAIL